MFFKYFNIFRFTFVVYLSKLFLVLHFLWEEHFCTYDSLMYSNILQKLTFHVGKGPKVKGCCGGSNCRNEETIRIIASSRIGWCLATCDWCNKFNCLIGDCVQNSVPHYQFKDGPTKHKLHNAGTAMITNKVNYWLLVIYTSTYLELYRFMQAVIWNSVDLYKQLFRTL